MWEYLPVFIFAAGGFAALTWWYELSVRRTRKLRQFAAANRLTFRRAERIEADPALRRVSALKGFARRAYNVMRGEHRGSRVIAFELPCPRLDWASYRPASSKNESMISVCVRPLGVEFPRLLIRPDSWLQTDLFGFLKSDDSDDMSFESDDFNRSFRVTTEDRKFACDFVHPRMMELLLTRPQWLVKLGEGCLIVHNWRQWGPEECREAFDLAADVVEQIPEHVWRRYRQADALLEVTPP